MAREYFPMYHGYLDTIEALGDAERGRLFTACLQYSKTGTVPELSGNERYVWPGIRAQIDRDNANYEVKCAKNRANGGQRTLANASERYRTLANATQGKGKGKGEGEGEYTPPLTPPPGGDDGQKPEIPRVKMIVPPDLPEEVQDAMTRWKRYKAERGDRYKPVGWSALCARVRGMMEKHGAAAVVDIINASMASGYSGITWDRIGGSARTQQGAAKPQRPTSYDLTEIERMTRGRET